MKVQRGDVVILDHPFSDATASKVRPALVVQANKRNVSLTNTVVVMITKNLSRVGTDPTQPNCSSTSVRQTVRILA